VVGVEWGVRGGKEVRVEGWGGEIEGEDGEG